MTTKNKVITERAYSLDALRGYAILTMVLSGAVASGVLPGWMYHAQVPPPDHIFNPGIYGITWVDLVFPFFLFAMGAAFPFSIGKRMEKGESTLLLVWDAIKRGIQLTFFAIFIQHFYPYMLSSPQDPRAWGLALVCFALLFPMFMRIPIKMPKWAHFAIKISAYAIAVILLLTVKYADGRVFSLANSNIIILVLANMSIFGSIIYIFTKKNKWARILILPFIMAVILGSATDGSWQQAVFNYSPLPWMYKFMFLKYLFIIIPGSIAGEYLIKWMNKEREGIAKNTKNLTDKSYSIIFLILTIALIVVNLCCLYTRYLITNLALTATLLILGIYLLKDAASSNQKLWKDLFYAGAYLLALGLFFEAYEGGIRKDHSTFSYYFVTSGLAFMALLAFNIICDYYKCTKSTKFLVMSGQNPMIAYVTTNLFTMPILGLVGLLPYLSYLSATAWLGFFRGVIITTIAVLVTMFFTKIKWFWRT